MQKFSKPVIRISVMMIVVLAYQLVFPVVAHALTTGPSQPEVQSFEPVGTTDMVDLFSGDFVYNIPLMDVEGYPINIAYHGGVTMEQEASWVGLGWNISPGVVNRAVRGLPDDFKGDSIMKQLHIKDEKNLRFGVGLNVEPAGVGAPIVDLSASLGANVNMSNYRGVSCDFSFGAGVNLFRCVSAGVNLGVGSQSGADIDYNAGLQMTSSQILSGDAAGDIGVGFTSGYNTRSGLKDRSLSVRAGGRAGGFAAKGPNGSATVPIGLKNMVPVITNSSTMSSLYGQIRVGGEVAWTLASLSVNGMGSTLHYNENGSRKGYGYLYASDAAGDDDIMDFTRDRDGMFNKSMQFLPPGNMTYDVYNVTGQGTGGSFRPFRNDVGSVYDPITQSNQAGESATLEAGVGWNFSLGGDGTKTNTNIYSGPWETYKRPFKGNIPGSLYESSYFKQAGELTKVDGNYYNSIGGQNPVSGGAIRNLPLEKAGAANKRDPRGNHIAYFNGLEASQHGVADQKMLYSYKSNNGFANGPVAPKDSFARYSTQRLEKQQHHISEVMQTQTDGRRYVYGIPAINNVQKEVVFAAGAANNNEDKAMGLIAYAKGVDDSRANRNGIDNYYNSTLTPAYAHSYLLTSVLGTDYNDVTGDGPSDDDLGTYTKFNYTRKDADYRWRAPVQEGKAQYNQGFVSDEKDDKGSYVIGSREQWLLHSVETKNYVAEFYTSPRHDGMGVRDSITLKGDGYNVAPYNQFLSSAGKSYKLDSIKLYNKHDRFINRTSAIPVKTVFFTYDYSLCRGVPNVDSAGAGKLTLRKIYFRHGNSDRSMLSPYQFNYTDDSNPFSYNMLAKDRWGNYKSNSGVNNFEYPFVNQNDPDNDLYAGAWSLNKIQLPSGGAITVNYESDDYAYVQNRQAMEMFKLEGVGNSRQYSAGNKLYFDKGTPALYVYFKRRPGEEKPGIPLKDIYLKGQSCLYYNFSTRLVNSAYEPIKGYAGFEPGEVGVCENDQDMGYIKLEPTELEQGSGNLHPATYTALNVARYNLPHILFPGNDNSLGGMLAGMKYAFTELLEIGKNPIKRMVGEGKAREIDLSKSYIRLCSIGFRKKGGGQRVKSLLFYDNWQDMAGGNAHNATYGKQYDYTMVDPSGDNGIISSGVASFEPQVGGDENPFRVPVTYQGQSSSKWPPNDPVVLYQETPIGESFFPQATVGYSKVTVSSIHKDEGRSSQAIDISEFYTARDFPVQVRHTPMDIIKDTETYGFTSQSRTLEVTQGYTYVLNDMHGKPKRVEHRVHKPMGNIDELISYQVYKYHESGGQLDNNVTVVDFVPGSSALKKTTMQLGVESDITIDTREKKEDTDNDQLYLNFNLSTVGIIPVPLPLPIPWTSGYHNCFRMAVATKIVQQYGILKEVQSYQEGAVTTVRNEVFDPNTGQVLITSTNNEFRDKIYNANLPAYWQAPAMGSVAKNQGFTDHYSSLNVAKVHELMPHSLNISNQKGRQYRAGDEVLLNYKYNGVPRTVYGIVIITAAITGVVNILPKYGLPSVDIWPQSNQTFTDVNIKIIRSGYKNQLTSTALSIVSGEDFFKSVNGNFKDSVQILSAKESLYYSGISTADTLSFDIYNNGQYSVLIAPMYKSMGDKHYQNDRKYAALNVRKAGYLTMESIFASDYYRMTLGSTHSMMTLLMSYGAIINSNVYSDYNKVSGTVDLSRTPDGIATGPKWVMPSMVTAISMMEKEQESRDALGNYSAALYGYNMELPVAVGSNVRKYELLYDGYEDYQMLQIPGPLSKNKFSPFRKYFTTAPLYSSRYHMNQLTGSNGLELVKTKAHTGYYALKIPSGSPYFAMNIPVYPGYLRVNYDQPFCVDTGKKYIMSYWIRPASIPSNALTYTIPTEAVTGMTNSIVAKSNIIDGWQQVEAVFTVPNNATGIELKLPGGYYIDDLRVYPQDANIKSFVYNPLTQKLVATLDENNYATFYEYDHEGSLVRTKRETERGIITLSESRNAQQAH